MILGTVCILVLTTPFVLLFFFAAFYIFTSLPLSDVQDIVDAKSRIFGLAYACLTGRYAMIGVLLCEFLRLMMNAFCIQHPLLRR